MLRVHRYVRRGEHAIHILAPITHRIAEEEARSPADVVREVVLGFRGARVFDLLSRVSQIAERSVSALMRLPAGVGG